MWIVDVRDWLDRWVAGDLLSPEVAERLREDVDRVPALEAGAAPDGSAQTAGRVRGMVLEAVGYLGAALTFGALAILFDVTQWPQVVVVLLLLATSGVAGWGVWQLTPATMGAASRLASVSGVTSAAALGGALLLAFEPNCVTYGSINRCGWLQDNLLPFAILFAVTSWAVAIHRQHATAITHWALGSSAVGLTWATAHLPWAPRLGDSTLWREEELAFGALLTVAALAWGWASETERLRPAWIGTFGAGAAFFVGLAMITGYDPFFGQSDSLPILAALASGCAALYVGVSGDRLRLTIIGVVALLFTIPMTLTEVLGLDGVTVTFVMLPVGLALLGWAIREGRQGGIAGE